jgi:VWFA-related protein
MLRTNTQAVSIDVVVSKGNDEPVLALHRQDFQVFEDGKPQTIDLFEEHSAPANAPAAAPHQLPPHVYTNQPAAPQSDSVNVLLLDSLNTPMADQAYVHKQILSLLQNIQPGTRIAIFTLNTRLRLLQGFTADPALLRAALDRKAAAPGSNVASRTRDDDLRDKEEVEITGEMSDNSNAAGAAAAQAHARTLADQADSQGSRQTALTLAALQQLARSMAAIPGRKNLIWFATTFPVSIFPDGLSRRTLPNGQELEAAVRKTADLLTQAKVAVYPVSAQGIMVDHTTNADSAGQPLGDDFEKSPNQQSLANLSNTGAMEQLAADTGGKANYTTNNLNEAMAQAIQDGSHYYTLVYTPPSTKLDGRFHHIEVKLTAGKMKLSYRRGYYADSPTGTKPAADPLPPLLANGLPASTQILYQARVVSASPQPAADSPRAGGNAKLSGVFARYKVDLVINPATLALDLAADGTHNGKIEVALVAYDQAGKAANWTGETLGLTLNPASYAQVQRDGIPVHLQIDLPQADLSLSTGVYDLTAHKAGTLEIAVPSPSGAATPTSTLAAP